MSFSDLDPQLFRSLTVLLTAYYSRRIGSDRAAIDDLVQETLLAVHQQRASYDPARPFRHWLFGIARYKLIDHFRRQRPHLPLDECDGDLVFESFEGSSNARIDIDRLLGAIPARQAEIIRTTHLDGHTAAEAGERLGVGEVSVRVMVCRGMKSLTKIVER